MKKILVVLTALLMAACGEQEPAQPEAREPAKAQQHASVDDKVGSKRLEVYKSPTCGCCGAWVDHMKEHGYTVEVHDTDNMQAIKEKAGILPGGGSCHTAFIDGYVIEGHVPAADIRRILEERPDAVGLAVPGMPYGSPGMGPEDDREAYDVFLIRKDGSTEVFSSYAEG